MKYYVEYEWTMTGTIEVEAESEAEAMGKELTSEEVKEILSNGSFSKGSLEAFEANEAE